MFVTPVASFDTEIEAELARGALENEGIRAEVRFSAKAPFPRYAIGYAASGLGLPLSMYELFVAEDDASDARRVLAAARGVPHDGPDRRKHMLRIYAVVMLVPLLAVLVASAVQQLRLLF